MLKGHQTFAILFWLKKVASQDSTRVIYLRLTVDNKRVEMTTHLTIATNLWDQNAQKAKGKTEAAQIINRQLGIMQADIHRHYGLLLSMGKPISAEIIKNAYLGIGEKPKSLSQTFDFHYKRFEEKVKANKKSAGSLRRFKIAKNKVTAFMKHEYALSDKLLHDLKYSFIVDFEHYLTTVENSCYNTATKYLKILKQVIKMAVEQEWLTSNPFQSFKCTYEESQREKLTMEEITTLYNQELHSERLQEVRDVYVFCCFTGYAYQDVYNLTQENLVTGIDGGKWIMKNRLKTDNPERVPLLPVPLEILARYKDHPYCVAKNCLLPVNSNQKYNAYLKEIAVLAGIKKHLTTHTARHTFATTVTLENDVPIETVSQMLGHKSIKTTQIYAKITQRKVSNNMRKLKERLTENYPNAILI